MSRARSRTNRTARSRGLAASLHRSRTDAGMTIDDVAARTPDLSRSTIGRMETGERVPTPEETAVLLAAMGVGGSAASYVMDLARRASESHWWEGDRPGLSPLMQSWIDWEDQASGIVEWTLDVVPGLLQTAEYARQLAGAWASRPAEIEARVATRMARQTLLSRDTVSYDVVIDEAVLHRPIGGATLLVDQLRHLIRTAERPNISLQVLPTAATVRAHRGLIGSFIALQFSDKDDPLVQIEHISSAVIVDDPAEVEAHLAAHSTLTEMAMSPAESADLIRHVVKEME
ncbi:MULTISPECIES: helix-turn-helix domain-containing protein [Actinoalloteichus]|nr:MULTISPECIES: helix-turn-helix transcriptional regulator [Actinoalloteichus]